MGFKWAIIDTVVNSQTFPSGNRHSGASTVFYTPFINSGGLYCDIEVMWTLSNYQYRGSFMEMPNRLNGLDVFLSYPGEIVPSFSGPSFGSTYARLYNSRCIGSIPGLVGRESGKFVCASGHNYLQKVPLFPSGEHTVSFSDNLDLESPILSVTTRIKVYSLSNE